MSAVQHAARRTGFERIPLPRVTGVSGFDHSTHCRAASSSSEKKYFPWGSLSRGGEDDCRRRLLGRARNSVGFEGFRERGTGRWFEDATDLPPLKCGIGNFQSLAGIPVHFRDGLRESFSVENQFSVPPAGRPCRVQSLNRVGTVVLSNKGRSRLERHSRNRLSVGGNVSSGR